LLRYLSDALQDEQAANLPDVRTETEFNTPQ